jgi:hypothetical protein
MSRRVFALWMTLARAPPQRVSARGARDCRRMPSVEARVPRDRTRQQAVFRTVREAAAFRDGFTAVPEMSSLARLSWRWVGNCAAEKRLIPADSTTHRCCQ